MRIIGIETSCDETAVATIEIFNKNFNSRGEQSRITSKIKVLSSVVSSQVKLHAKYGGVVPSLAAREHVKNIEHVFRLALKETIKNGKWKMENGKLPVDLIAVTRGPGLGPSLLVGLAFARTLAWKYNKPLIGVNHLEGHIYSNWLKPVGVTYNLQLTTYNFPILNLIVSGGHTELVLMTGYGKYKVIGETLDDAVGEAFDKVARLLDLGYPGGPTIALRAEQWKFEIRNSKFEIKFPRPMINSKNYDFSYAGLKTSVLYKVRDLENAGIKLTENIVNQICYEFQNAALNVLIVKTIRAIQEYKIKSLFLSGGVSANKELRKRLEIETKKLKINYSQPAMEYTTDNATMVAAAGYFNYIKHSPPHSPLSKASEEHGKTTGGKEKTQDLTWESVEMDANLGF